MKIWIHILVISASPTVSRSVLKVISHILNEMKTITTKMMLASRSETLRSSVDTSSTRCGPRRGGLRVPAGPLVVSAKPGLLLSSWDATACLAGRKIPMRRQEDMQQPWVACEWPRKTPVMRNTPNKEKDKQNNPRYFFQKTFIVYWSIAD